MGKRNRRSEPIAHGSGETEAEAYRRQRDDKIKQQGSQLVREAECAKAQIYKVPGERRESFGKSVAYALLLDDNYEAVASHLDRALIKSIKAGEYVDFGKLLPKDRVEREEDNRLEIVNKGGNMFWVPVAERERSKINSIQIWDTAFRVYSRVYTEEFSGRSIELFDSSFCQGPYPNFLQLLKRVFGVTCIGMTKNLGCTALIL